jgi:hypothetical protein
MPTEDITRRIREEGPLSATEAARRVPNARGRHPHVSRSAVIRWILRGKYGVRLEATMLGGESWYTSQAALDRFFAAISARELERHGERSSVPALPLDRERRAAAAVRELERLRKG